MSKDGSMVLTAAYDKSARVWDTASGKCLAVLASSAQVVRCAVSPSGRLAATATQDHSIQIWDLPSGRILQDLTVSLPPAMSEPLCRCGTDRALDQATA